MLVPVVLFKPVAGDHLYVEAPLTVRVAGLPLHTDVLALVVRAGTAFTVTVTLLLLLQLFVIPVTE